MAETRGQRGPTGPREAQVAVVSRPEGRRGRDVIRSAVNEIQRQLYLGTHRLIDIAQERATGLLAADQADAQVIGLLADNARDTVDRTPGSRIETPRDLQANFTALRNHTQGTLNIPGQDPIHGTILDIQRRNLQIGRQQELAQLDANPNINTVLALLDQVIHADRLPVRPGFLGIRRLKDRFGTRSQETQAQIRTALQSTQLLFANNLAFAAARDDNMSLETPRASDTVKKWRRGKIAGFLYWVATNIPVIGKGIKWLFDQAGITKQRAKEIAHNRVTTVVDGNIAHLAQNPLDTVGAQRVLLLLDTLAHDRRLQLTDHKGRKTKSINKGVIAGAITPDMLRAVKLWVLEGLTHLPETDILLQTQAFHSVRMSNPAFVQDRPPVSESSSTPMPAPAA